MDKSFVEPASGLVVPRFANAEANTFARLPLLPLFEYQQKEKQNVQLLTWDIAIVGVPFDAGTSYRPGARFGPTAIRNASKLLRSYQPSLSLYPFKSLQVVDAGDIGCNPFNIKDALKSIENRCMELMNSGSGNEGQKKRIISLGGDHTISLPLLRVANKHFGPLTLIHFDAHLDTWDTYFGEPYTHGTPFRRAREEGLFKDDTSMHVGIRGSIYDQMDLDDDRKLGFQIIHCMEIEKIGVEGVVERIKNRVGMSPLYISIDIDVLDPGIAPGTGTPEIGGFTSRELQGILRGLKGLNVVGADVMEVSPAYDHAEVTALAAANIVYELICLMALSGPSPKMTDSKL